MITIRGQIFVMYIATIAAQFALTSSANAVTEQEYATRCAKALALCSAGDERCAGWRQAFNEHGSVCPGVNASSTATMKGPPPSPNIHPPVAPSYEEQTGTLADLQGMCSPRWGWHGFIEQTECRKRVIDRSQDSPNLRPSNPYVALYLLQAERLIDEVHQKRISETDASVELQKTYLEVLTLQSAANESALRAAALQQQEATERTRLADDARARELQKRVDEDAARQAQNTEAEHRQADAIAFCVQQADQRLFANPGFINGHMYLGVYPVGYPARTFTNVNSYCSNDPAWYSIIPPPPTRINCSGNGTNSFSCTSQ